MRYRFINGVQYQWSTETDQKGQFYFKGYFFYGNNIFRDSTAIEKLRELFLPLLKTPIKNIEKRVPLGRLANEAEYRKAISFLASEDSSYMTGQVLVMDGGRTTW